MKKYLMMMAVAGLALASCNKMDGYTTTPGEIAQAKYNQAFYNYVKGNIDPEHTWGFGDDVYSTAPAFDFTRAIDPTFNFPSDADASKFLAAVPATVEKLTQNAASVNGYIDESWTGELNIWGGYDQVSQKTSGGTIYLKGDLDFSNRSFYIAPNTEVFLLEGTTLTLRAEDSGNLQEGCNFYMAANSKIDAAGELKLNKGLHIYNHGTIETPTLSTNSNSLLYNVGTVNVSGKMSVENTLSVVVNDGEINAGSVQTAGSGKMQNNADFKVTGETLVNSNENTWVNNGQYHTGYFTYNASSREVINNCRLTVENTFSITLGDSEGAFRMDSNSGVVASSMHVAGPFFIEMGANSVFKVTGTAVLDARKANYGIYGPTSGGYAVFQAQKIEKGKDDQGYEVTYGNNLYVYSETSHFENGMSGQYPYIDFKGGCSEDNIYASNFTSGKPAITINETTCNPGFTGTTPPSTPQADTNKIRIIAEDLSADGDTDFDFNDVVLDVTFGNPATVILTHAGGTLPLRINGNNAYEVHKLFGVWQGDETIDENTPKQKMVNTGAGTSAASVDLTNVLNVSISSRSEADTKLKLEVYKGGEWVEMKSPKGEPACKLAVGQDFTVLPERKSIKGEYPNFLEWVENENFSSQWWQ